MTSTASRKPSAVCVPTLPRELEAIHLSHQWWMEGAPPCAGDDPGSKVDLVYLLPESFNPDFEASVKDSFSDTRLDRIFASLRFHYANLPSDKIHYIRQTYSRPPNEFGLRAGPNFLFFYMIEVVGEHYQRILQMETDCFPIRPGWLDRLHELDQLYPDRWVIGSRYKGPELPKPWTNHLNGNAIYKTGSAEFRSLLL